MVRSRVGAGVLRRAGARVDGGLRGPGCGNARDLAQQAAAAEILRAEPRGHGEHHLSVRHHRERGDVQPLRPSREASGVAAWADIPARAQEGEQVSLRTGVAADAGGADDPTPIDTTARPAGVVACRCCAPLTPDRPSAFRDTGAPSLRATRARTVTVALRDRPFRRNVRCRGPNDACCRIERSICNKPPQRAVREGSESRKHEARALAKRDAPHLLSP